MKKIFTYLALAALSSSVMAATKTWDGAGDGSTYTDGANWGGTAPVNDTTTDIAQLTGGTVNLDADRSVNGLDVNAASTLTGTGTRLTLGGGGLTGTSDLTLNNTVTLRTGTVTPYAGAVTIDGAAVEVTTGTQGALGTGTITLDNGGAIVGYGSHVNMRDTTSMILGSGGGTVANSHGYAFYGLNNAVISGTGQLTLDGGGSTHSSSRIQVDGDHTYTGGTLIMNKANAQIYGDASFGAANTKVTIDDARMVTTGAANYGAREFAIASGGGRISLNDRNSEIAGLLSGTGALIIDGQNRDGNDGTPSGVLRLTSTDNTHSGGITIDGVTVDVQNGTSFGSSVVTLDNGGTIGSEGGHGNLLGLTGIVLGSGGGTLQNKHSNAIYNIAAISGAGMLTLDGNGSTAYSSDSRIQLTEDYAYTGDTRIQNKANAVIYKTGSLGAAGTKVTIDDGRLATEGSFDIDHEIEIASGGGTVALNGKAVNFLGPLTGAGALEINGQNRDDDDATPNGELRVLATGTITGDVTLRENITVRVGADNAFGTGTVTIDDGALLRNHVNAKSLDNNVVIGSGGGRLGAAYSSTMTLNGVVSGSADVTIISGSGTVSLANVANTYSGAINLEAADSKLSVESLGAGATISGDAAATLTLTGAISLDTVNGFAGLTTVSSGASIAGSGSLAGSLTINAGGQLVFSTTDTLTVDGTVTLASTFGIDDLIGISSSTADGTYTLIDGTSTDFSTLTFENFGSGNAYDLGGGKSAYFENGSLAVTVIPEPATLGILAAAGAGMLFIRRRFMI